MDAISETIRSMDCSLVLRKSISSLLVDARHQKQSVPFVAIEVLELDGGSGLPYGVHAFNEKEKG